MSSSRTVPSRKRRGAAAASCALLALAALPAAHAQDSSSPASREDERPRIGLALSGGGARGGAHIGVLRALEELRVPIDYIAGTSIGAIVGGFYAAGHSTDDLEELVRTIDWDTAFLNITPRQLRSFRRKRDDDSFLVRQRPGLNRGEIELPLGLVQGQTIDLIIAQYTLSASTVDDFDELRVPFRAVAADIATGEAVVLEEGSLARAIRASMALPAALPPVEIDNQLLVDGGIAMNLPVEIARELGADIVIAVDISAALREREELRSVLDVTSQLTNLLTREGVERQRELLVGEDVLLQPEFGPDLTSVDFELMPNAIDYGYAIAMENRESLERYSLPPDEYAEYRRRLDEPMTDGLPIIDFVRLDNKSRIADSVLLTRMRDVVVGEQLSLDTIERAVGQAYGLELFQNVRYQVVSDGDETGLEIEVVPRSWGPNYLQLGMAFNSSGDVDATFGLAASYLRTAVNDKGGEWRATFVVGDEPAFTLDIYQPFGPAALFFVEPVVDFRRTQFNLFADDQLVSEAKLREAMVEVSFGRELLNWGEARAGLRRIEGETKLHVGDPTHVPAADYSHGEFFARFSVDTLDNIAFPREGLLTSVEWIGSSRHLLGADHDYEQLRLSATHARTWGRHTLLSTFRYDATISGDAPLDRSFRLGGFLDLSGLANDQLIGKYASRIGASYYRRIGDLALFPAFAGVTLELGNTWGARNDISLGDTLWGGSIWAGVDTPVGPIYVGYGRAEGDRDAAYVHLGRAF
jgi:NTE family protein